MKLLTKLGLLSILAVLFFALQPGIVQAQDGITESGTGTLRDLYIPERDRNGALIWQMKGEKADRRPDGKLEITNLTIQTFRNGIIDWTLTTPHCIFFTRTNEDTGKPERIVASESPVEIISKKMEIRGMGFHWLVNSSQFIIRKDARVKILEPLTQDPIP